MKKKNLYTFIFMIMVAFCMASCEKEPATATQPVITLQSEKTITIGDIEINIKEAVLDLNGMNIDDISPLYEMTNLKLLDIRNNPISNEEIEKLMKNMPDCEVVYSVLLGSKYYDSTIESIDLSRTDELEYDELKSTISLFQHLNSISMTSSQISVEEYREIADEYPDIKMQISVMLCGKYYEADIKKLDLSECDDIDYNAFAYFSALEKIDFGEKVLDDMMMDELISRFPDAEFVWNVELLDDVFSSVEKYVDVSYTAVKEFDAFKSKLKYLTSLERINMTYCYVKNDAMEELCRAYPNVKFIWRVWVGSWELSTDVRAFSTGNTDDFEGGRYRGDGDTNLLDDDVQNLKYCTEMEALDIGHKMYITDFSFLQYMPDLKILIVAWTQVNDINMITHLEDLEYLEIFSNGIEDFSPLLQLENLKYLNCSNNEMDDVNVFLEMPQLKKLWLVSCENISETDRERLYEGLPDCQIVFDAPSPTNGGWRSRDNDVYKEMRETFGLRPVYYD